MICACLTWRARDLRVPHVTRDHVTREVLTRA